MKGARMWLGLFGLFACGESATRSGPPTVVVRLVLDPSPAKAVHLEVSGPGTNAFTSGGDNLLVESTLLSDRIAVAVFGETLEGQVGVLTGVAPSDAGIVQVAVRDAVGSDNNSLPHGVVTARVVVDTIQ